MPNIPVSIVGLKKNIDIVTPIFPVIAGAFAPFGITLTRVIGEELDSDPETTTGGWRDLIARLQEKSKAQSVVHLVLTDDCPDRIWTINGQLRDPDFRSIAAVYFGADLFWKDGDPLTNINLVTQVCIHEIGHLFNLIHDDATPLKYSSAMLQATHRNDEASTVAWHAAIAEAADNHEAPLIIPDPVTYYPFSSICRANLRSATTGSPWLPFQKNFRDMGDDTDEIGDEYVKVDVARRDRHSRIHIGGEIYFTLSITNRRETAIEIPYDIGPQYGSLRVCVKHSDGSQTYHRPADYCCSGARQILKPGESTFRSLALSGPLTGGLSPGSHTCVIKLVDPRAQGNAVLGRTVFNVIATADVSLAKKSDALRGLMAGKRKSASYSKDIRGIPKECPLAAHFALEHAIRLKSNRRRRTLLRDCQRPIVPRAIRHMAARHEYNLRMRDGENREEILREIRSRFRSKRDLELFDLIQRIDRPAREKNREQ
ncbi:hypothetical protein [Paraburkholderia sp. RL17-347-BIC-D]|uniref:hypothetical protein n=1 Tax=Paraburkholderia sp. RL17-347-BIC-D TaxID=3031632 RepID=UPI0038BCA35E